jgi:hypothetical protein
VAYEKYNIHLESSLILAPGYEHLRILVDYERYLQSNKSWFHSHADLTSVNMNLDDLIASFRSLSEREASEIAAKAFTTPKQSMIIFELDRLSNFVAMSHNQTSEEANEKLFKSWRLMVKHRLLCQETESLHSCSSKQAMKDMIADMFNETYNRYMKILKQVQLTKENREIEMKRLR